MRDTRALVSPNDIRGQFSNALSKMYQEEVPQYGTLLEIVRAVNDATLGAAHELDRRLVADDKAGRMAVERHGAIRVGTQSELFTMRRLFAVMGMFPVGYYDLSVAGVPVHSTAFRPVDDEALRQNPFRVFTSLLRLDLIADTSLRDEAADILARRQIFTSGCLAHLEKAEAQGGLTDSQAHNFVLEALETFRWHREAAVSIDVYERFKAAHPLVADVVCFKGPHINHLTPRTLDIDAAQNEMIVRQLSAKAVIEGPPGRSVPILLRQTSFKALEESVAFRSAKGDAVLAGHTARFGEIEQRGIALTPKGRALYDSLLSRTREEFVAAAGTCDYMGTLAKNFREFPDSEPELRLQNLAYFRYRSTDTWSGENYFDLEAKLSSKQVRADPITYEDFLPVSAAGIFRSNLGDGNSGDLAHTENQAELEGALGAKIIDPDALYRAEELASLRAVGLSVR